MTIVTATTAIAIITKNGGGSKIIRLTCNKRIYITPIQYPLS